MVVHACGPDWDRSKGRASGVEVGNTCSQIHKAGERAFINERGAKAGLDPASSSPMFTKPAFAMLGPERHYSGRPTRPASPNSPMDVPLGWHTRLGCLARRFPARGWPTCQRTCAKETTTLGVREMRRQCGWVAPAHGPQRPCSLDGVESQALRAKKRDHPPARHDVDNALRQPVTTDRRMGRPSPPGTWLTWLGRRKWYP